MLHRLKTNKIIKFLILSDLSFWAGWGFITPIFAIFIVQKIDGATALTVGIATAVFWIVRSLFMIPIGVFLDSTKSEKDDFFAMVLGLFLNGFVPIGYLFAHTAGHLYFLQAIYGFGMALMYSGWMSIFSKHIDKGKESTQWNMDLTAVGVGLSLAGVLGGWSVDKYGFDLVFWIAGILIFAGGLVALALRKEIVKG